MNIKTIGFPCISNFGNDIREFLPSLFEYFNSYEDIEIFLEKGYGKGFGFEEEDYTAIDNNIKFVDNDEVYKKDLIIILKMPEIENLEKMLDGKAIFTMCHFGIRPKNAKLFYKKNIQAFSMDSIVDDKNIRMFVDYFYTAYNGANLAVSELQKVMPNFSEAHRKPIMVSIIGAGELAKHCVTAFEELFYNREDGMEIGDVFINLMPRAITTNDRMLIPILKNTDILVDATKRKNQNEYIIQNELIGRLPDYAIILDLAADRYDGDNVKGIEGTIRGEIDSPIIPIDDARYDLIPSFVSSKNRRLNVSCGSWPGISPYKSMVYYQKMIIDYLNVFMDKDIMELSLHSENKYERGLYRSTLDYHIEMTRTQTVAIQSK